MRSLAFAAAASLAFAFAFSFAACSDETGATSTADDAGTDGPARGRDGGDVEPPLEDGGNGDANEPPLASASEKEPNDGAKVTDIDTMAIPSVMNGAIDPADDVDIFAITPAAGELWEWTLAPKGADLAPHLTIFDTAADNLNPNVVAAGSAAETITLQHFVLGGGKFVAAVRDARNVPTATGKGGPTFGYALTARKKTPQPTAVTFPETKTGKLASLSSVDLYSFKVTAGMQVAVIIRADRKAAPSTLDSRLSVFNVGLKKSAGTNDDAAGGTTDSELGGALPAGDYIAVVENEGTNGADLSYEIEFALK